MHLFYWLSIIIVWHRRQYRHVRNTLVNDLKSVVWRWFQQGAIPEKSLSQALSLVSVATENEPDSTQWRTLNELLLTWGAALLLGSGLIFFIAANWQSMSSVARFALVESALVLALALYLVLRMWAIKRGDPLGFGYTSANAVLFATSVIIGSLLALLGQTYQTGADPWQLFALWALFIVPIALVAGSELLWLLLGLLVNLAVVLYYQTFPGLFGRLFLFDLALEALFLLNLLLHFSFLLLSGKLGALAYIPSYRPQRFAAPLLQHITITIAVFCITLLVIEAIFDGDALVWLGGYLGFITAGALLYNLILKQIFVLAIGGFSLVAVTNSLLLRLVLEGQDPVGMLLVLGLTIIGSTSLLSLWLKQRQQAFQLDRGHDVA
ncbi:conserved hypothetical protein [Shewanella halifaxensis HAW-EB4]|uniref:DUF2157 domain-containing protein n=1 Tax=Shewanella halifaxensis (strain HAW-EB4) TaxID=458817 RepID=B0TJK6_SHEHH|nr:conserved hypothetical protein [Shewanella halifaxensis HAW-EB4]